jgi:hypothetical protein
VTDPLTPEWTIITVLFEFGVLGVGSYIAFVKVVPWFSGRDSMHSVLDQRFAEFWFGIDVDFWLVGILPVSEYQQMQTALWGVFRKAKHWFDHPISFMVSWFFLRGGAFVCLIGTEGLLLTSVGWHDPLSLSGFYYDVVFARTNVAGNAAHLSSFLPIPAVGIYAAYKFPARDEHDILLRILVGSFAGLLVAALGVAIHEGLWIVFYYAFYAQYLSWGVLDNVLKDIFFVVMLACFYQTYRKFPLPKVPLSVFRTPTLIYLGFLFLWALLGFHISTINNYVYGKGVYGETQWYSDALTNFLEVASWDLLYVGMAFAIWKVKPQRLIVPISLARE